MLGNHWITNVEMLETPGSLVWSAILHILKVTIGQTELRRGEAFKVMKRCMGKKNIYGDKRGD